MDEPKITTEELRAMFGPTIPMEAVAVIHNNAPMTCAEARAKLHEIAKRHRDIVVRLREFAPPGFGGRYCEGENMDMIREAADTIERLRGAVDATE